MEEKLSALVNLLWKECIQNLNSILEKDEINKFSNNDYYYLLVIQSLQTPNFSQIADELSLTKPAVSAIIRKLVNMNLVDKVQSQEDKRIHYVKLTKKGESILQGDNAIYKCVTNTIASIVPDKKELELFEGILTALLDKLEEKNK